MTAATALLRGTTVPLTKSGPARDHAVRLLALLGATVDDDRQAGFDEAAVHASWATSGAMLLTGDADGPPRSPGWATAAAMNGAADVFAALTELLGHRAEIDGAALLGERAAHSGATRSGPVSPGGSCRLVAAADGWLAVNLARPADVDLLPAWLEVPFDGVGAHPWPEVTTAVASRATAELEARAAELGLPISVLRPPTAGPAVPFRITGGRNARPADRRRNPLQVVDLSSLWAGPLCANLLGLAGASVVKVESATRPDGARAGWPAFYELLHRGHRSIALPFDEPEGRAALRELLTGADVVVDASRPRAMEQLGIDVDEIVAGGTTWVGITAYGRDGANRHRVGFGDDVAVAAGLVAGTADRPLFCADAAADPVTGLHAAVAAVASILGGGGHLVDVSMRGAVASTMGDRRIELTAAPSADAPSGWVLDTGAGMVPVAVPRSR